MVNAPQRVVVMADSLALPRIQYGQSLAWEETWPYQLQRTLRGAGLPTEVINCGARARTADMLLGDDFKEHVVLKRPDHVVLQVGVVDCMPRIFSKLENRVLRLAPIPDAVRERIISWRKSRRAEITRRDPLAKVYSSPELYERSLRAFFAELGTCDWPVRVAAIPTVTHRARMGIKSPRHHENVVRYNDILERVCREFGAAMIDTDQALPEREADDLFMVDGYHLSAEGSRRLAVAVASHLVPTIVPQPIVGEA